MSLPRRNMTVGFYSPLPPARTGVADYSAALLGELRRLGNVEICPERCDVALYHLGNNALHAAIYQRALSHPGVVVLHDLTLHHLLLGMLSEEEYIDEVVYNTGEWGRELAGGLWRARAASGSDHRYFEMPLLRRVIETSLAAVVHNPEAARIAQAQAPGTRVVEIPHLYSACPQPDEAEVLRFRQALGVEPGQFLFGVFGYLRESKRLISVLEAFRHAHAQDSRIALLVAGGFVSTDLERAAGPLLEAPGVTRLPYLAEPDFRLAAAAVDACINLRSPAAGETSGIAIRLMGMGKPALLTDAPEYARFPEDACIRIPPGAAERESLISHMLLLTSVAEMCRAIGLRGAMHIAQNHRIDVAAKSYWDLLCEFSS